MEQVLRRVFLLSIPPEQCSYGKGMSKGMGTRWRHSFRHIDPNEREYAMKSPTDGVSVNWTLSEGKKRVIGLDLSKFSLPALDILLKALGHARPEGDEPRLGKLCLPDDQEVALQIDILAA
jgi:hypothetical protein